MPNDSDDRPPEQATAPATVLADLLGLAGVPPPPAGEVTIVGADPVLPTNYLLGTAGAAALAAIGVAASELWHIRTGRRQQVTVDMRSAAAAIRSERYVRVDGKHLERWAAVSGFYRTRDGRWIQLHANFPHHRDRALRVLGCDDDRAKVTAAVARHDGQSLEDALAGAGACAFLVRSRAEWQAHPQAAAVGALPLFDVMKIADSAPEPLPSSARWTAGGHAGDGGHRDAPLAGVRMLDLTRVIAGPVAGRTLAQHGADVLRITAPHLPDLGSLEVDTGAGKLSALLDLRAPGDAETLQALVRDADVFAQSYRPGALAARGLSPEALAALRPGIVCVTLSAWSHAGPWQSRRGFDSLVQSATGIVHEQTRGDRPQHLPAQVLDHVSGFLMAFGAMAALARRAREGGSYLVRVSLCQTAEWVHRLGRVSDGRDARTLAEPTLDDVADLLIETDTPFGRVRHVAPAVGLSETPATWTRPAVPPGTHQAAWPPRGIVTPPARS
jgi:crotonobetainyl-CoA:carnitine CoA-transferase CaiB-like acyl-CoA transferase